MIKRNCGRCVNCEKREELDEDENVSGLECLDPIILKKKSAPKEDIVHQVNCGWFDMGKGKCDCGAIQKSIERINHPSHYGGDTTYEAVKVIEAWGLGFCLGNAVKYICRFGKKDDRMEPMEDLRKAVWYINREIMRLEIEKKEMEGE